VTACGSLKDVVYLQNVNMYEEESISNRQEAAIHKDDLLAITVNSRKMELAAPFNLSLVNPDSPDGTEGGAGASSRQQLGYLVDAKGHIDFPVLGRLKVEGLTRSQLQNWIKNQLIEAELLSDPIVNVQFLNFRISVLGEVNKPGSYSVSGERITLFQAISMAGDLTIYGKRDRVAVIRESLGQRTIEYLDLRSTDVFESPCYYLQQNDIVYVEPNKRRAQQGAINQNNSISTWIGIGSALISTATFFISLSNSSSK
jgi:polysaccharide export outer membrane protein